MANQKYNPPNSPPPPAYGNDGTAAPNPPEPVHTGPQNEYYGASPYQNNASPHGAPPQNYPPQMEAQGPGGYYPSGPQMYQQPQGGYYGPQGGQPGYQQQGYGPGYYPQQRPYGPGPQGGYYDNRQGRSSGFMEALLASLACCCCLDACLLF